MPHSDYYDTKKLKYKLCELLLSKRRSFSGLGNTLRISFTDLVPLLEYAQAEDADERIRQLEDELRSLNDELIGPGLDKRVIKIIDEKILNSFVSKFRIGTQMIHIRCLSSSIEEYMSELKNRTEVALRQMGIVEIKKMVEGGVIIKIGDKSFKTGKCKIRDANIRTNIIKLMFGGPINVGGTMYKLEDYERGNHTSFKDIINIVRKIEGIRAMTDEIEVSPNEIRRVRDAARGLNEKSMKTFGSPLFNLNDEGLKWVL
ncbi:MAG: hypothetical protein WCF94_03010 [bacterium]